MDIPIAIGISLGAIVWSAGLACGLFASKFMNKIDCKNYREGIWNRIDALQDAMTGKPLHFELRIIKDEGK